MRLNRGDTAEGILAEYLKAEKSVTKSLVAKTEACPWPEGKEEAWERAFQSERRRLLEPHYQDSRTAFFVAKCQQELGSIKQWGREYADKHGPDISMPPKWLKHYEYWNQVLRYAYEQREIVLAEQQSKTQYSLEPSEEDLTMLEEIMGWPSEVTDDEIGRCD